MLRRICVEHGTYIQCSDKITGAHKLERNKITININYYICSRMI